MREPRVQKSTGFPCPDLNNISGARYSGVPHILFASYVPTTFLFDNPKSVNFIYPYLSIRIFSGFKLII